MQSGIFGGTILCVLGEKGCCLVQGRALHPPPQLPIFATAFCIRMKATKQLQEKLEGLMKAIDFKVRYEKGNFKSGYCIIEEQNVAVINKFFPMESKVAALVEILRTIEIDDATLDEPNRKLLHKVRQTEISL